MGGINSVQAFIRFVAFIITFIVISVLLLLPLGILSFTATGPGAAFVIGIVLNLWVSSIISRIFFVLPEWERIVVLRLGKFSSVLGPGFFVIPPFIYSVANHVDTRIELNQVEATATLTKDNVPTKVTGAIEYRVEDPKKAILDVLNYRASVTWLSTEALKNTIGGLDLRELLSDREKIADQLKRQIDEGAATYGIDVRAVRITDIDTPPSLVEELAVIARARRAAEAKQVQASAEVEVANKIAEASEILSKQESSIRLRELQILSDISKEESATIIVYPYGDRSALEIANTSAGAHSSDKKKHSKTTRSPKIK